MTADQPVEICDWEYYIQETATKVLQEQSAARLLEVRGRLYELLTHCIPAEVRPSHVPRVLPNNPN
jgi:replication factor C subunit 3/5